MGWTRTQLERSYACNSELLVQLRKQREWTQEEFAKVAGYSDRFIRKAESGKPISTDAIADLAEALSTDDAPVYPEDLISDPVHLAKEFMDAWHNKQLEAAQAIRHFLDDDVIFELVGDPSKGMLFSGQYFGVAGLHDFFQKFYSIMVVPEGHDHRPHFQYVGDGNEVMIVGKSYIHPEGVPLIEPLDLHVHMRFRRGKLFYIRDLVDTQKGGEAIRDYLEENDSDNGDE